MATSHQNSQLLCLVTGGAGFIGSHVAEALVQGGYRVRVLDDFSTGKKANLGKIEKEIEWVEGSICDEGAVRKAIQGVNYVFHLAANRAVLRSVDQPLETNEVNVTGTLRLLVAARDEKVRRFIFSSSSSVYGDTQKFPSCEEDLPNPQSPYAASKIMGEYYCRIFHSLYGLETVALRYFNVFGPRQNPESRYSAVIPIFIDCLLKKKAAEIHWDGLQSRDFSYVDNVVHGNLLAMKAEGVAGQVFNIACHEEHSVLDIFEGLKKILKTPGVTPTFAEKRAGDVRRTFADIRKSEQRLGFKAQTLFKEGLRKTTEWFLKNR